MSYSFGTEQTTKAAIVSDLGHAAEAQAEQLDPEVRAAFWDHIDEIARALPGLVATVGSDEATVKVAVAGHANPGHGRREGWADEFVQVHISVQEPVPATTEDADAPPDEG